MFGNVLGYFQNFQTPQEKALGLPRIKILASPISFLNIRSRAFKQRFSRHLDHEPRNVGKLPKHRNICYHLAFISILMFFKQFCKFFLDFYAKGKNNLETLILSLVPIFVFSISKPRTTGTKINEKGAGVFQSLTFDL